MDIIFIFLGLVLTITIGGLFFILGYTPQQQNTSTEKIEGTNFIPSQMYMGENGLGGIAVNERMQQICLFKSPSSRPELFPIADLIGSYLIKNGEIVDEAKRSFPNQVLTFSKDLHRIKQALIKSLHMGSSEDGHQRIDLLVMVYEPDEPILAINFLDMDVQEGSVIFEKSLTTAKHWHFVLDGLILEADKLARAQAETPQQKDVKEMAKTAP